MVNELVSIRERQFYTAVALTLGSCQFVEEQLKRYLEAAFDLIRKRLNGDMPFKFVSSEYDTKSLSRLVDLFIKVNDNKALIADLRTFQNERDFVAHQAVRQVVGEEDEVNHEAVQDLLPRLEKTRLAADLLWTRIAVEMQHITVRLDFDVVEDQ